MARSSIYDRFGISLPILNVPVFPILNNPVFSILDNQDFSISRSSLQLFAWTQIVSNFVRMSLVLLRVPYRDPPSTLAVLGVFLFVLLSSRPPLARPSATSRLLRLAAPFSSVSFRPSPPLFVLWASTTEGRAPKHKQTPSCHEMLGLLRCSQSIPPILAHVLCFHRRLGARVMIFVLYIAFVQKTKQK